MICKNCGTALNGPFCSTCGQKGNIHRITLSHLTHEFIHVMTHADKGIFLLVKQLLKRPGYVAKEYLEGKRKKYFNPLSFLVITTAATAFISFKTGYYEALSHPQTGRQPSHPYYMESMEIMVQNGKLLSLFLIVPLLAFFSRIFFFRLKYNFAEHIVLQSYLVGLINIFTALIFVPLFLLFPAVVDRTNWIFQVLFLVYMVIAYRQFFHNNLFLTILKSLLILILFIIFFWLVIVGYVMAKHALIP